MKIAVDQAIEIDFDTWLIEQAGKCLDDVRSKHRDRAHDVMRAMLALLLMGEVERQKPGSVDRMLSAVKSASAALCEPKAAD